MDILKKQIQLLLVVLMLGTLQAQTHPENESVKMRMQNNNMRPKHQGVMQQPFVLTINNKKELQLELEERSLEALEQAFEEKRYTIILKNPENSGFAKEGHPFVFRTRIFVNGTQVEEIEEEEEINMFPGDIFIPITHFACFPPVGTIIADTAAEDELKIELSMQSLKNEQQVDALVFFL